MAKINNVAVVATGGYRLVKAAFDSGNKEYTYLCNDALHPIIGGVAIVRVGSETEEPDVYNTKLVTITHVSDIATLEMVADIGFNLGFVMNLVHQYDLSTQTHMRDKNIQEIKDVKASGKKVTAAVVRLVCGG